MLLSKRKELKDNKAVIVDETKNLEAKVRS
jgi:hypothetical protein